MDPIILRIEPELDERAATATMSRAQRVYEQGARDISKVMRQQMTGATDAAGKGFDELETKARKAYLGMQDASEKVAAAERKHQAAVQKGAANAESLGRKVERARLAEIEAIERATAAYKEYGQAADQAGNKAVGGMRGAMAGMRSAGGEAASGFMEGFGGSAALARLGAAGGPIGAAIAGVAAIGLAGGKVLADNIAAGMEQLRMRDMFQARLGVDNGAMEHIGTSAGTAYAKGFGDSVEENLKTISAGIRSGLIGPKSSDADLSKFAERMNTTSKITGQDPTEIAAKSRNIVRNGLASNYTQILDLLNSEAGKQLDISGDLLDTTEEYATAWHGVGISATDAFGLMKQMSDAGIRNTDVAADSLKELSINVVDNSKTTRQAFTVLGLSADDMNKRFAQGGVAAREAFGAVLTALRDLQDPQDKENAGAALFKTKWEDAKTAIKGADLKTAATDMGSVGGATDAATKEIDKHADSWGNLGRRIGEATDSFQRWLADTGPGNWIGHTLPDALGRFFDPEPKPYIDNVKPAGPAQSAQDLGDLLGAPGPTVQGPGINHGVDTSPQRPAAPADIPGMLGTILTPNPNLPDPGPGLQHGPQDKHWADAAEADKTKGLPPAPVLPLSYTPTGGLPSGIANAVTSLDEKRHEVAEKEARLNQLQQTNVATADDIQKAKNDLTKAEQDRLKAEQSLTDARINAAKQANKQLSGLASGMEELGAQLDKDFGISKGLGGIVENAVKALGNILAAPFLQALGFVAKANPNEGSGLVGIAAANGMFGPQYTPGAIAAAQAMQSGGGYGGGYSGAGGPIAGLQSMPGESARDFAHRAMMPFWQNRGFEAGDHAADKYGEHQNGALDIMVPSIAAGQQVLQQVLRDPNVYGAIFNNQTYGYGHGQTPQDYTAGHTGNPTQDHQDHVHALYKPGGKDNIVPGASDATGSLNSLASAANSAANALGGGLSTQQWNNIAGAEASGNWQANTGNGFYGGLQIMPSTWNAFGGPQFAPRADLATPEQQMAVGNNILAGQGPGAWPATSAAHPEWFQPGVGIPASMGPGGGSLMPGMGQPQGLPGVGLGNVYPSQGGNSGNMFGGLAMDGIMAATSGLDMMMPGAGAAAKIGIQVANRTIGYAAQNMGIAANAVGEFLSVGDNPKGSIGAGWFGKFAGGIAGAGMALPNIAGGKKPPGPMEQAGGGQQQGAQDNSQVNNVTVNNNKAPEDQNGKVITEHLSAMRDTPGRQ